MCSCCLWNCTVCPRLAMTTAAWERALLQHWHHVGGEQRRRTVRMGLCISSGFDVSSPKVTTLMERRGRRGGYAACATFLLTCYLIMRVAAGRLVCTCCPSNCPRRQTNIERNAYTWPFMRGEPIGANESDMQAVQCGTIPVSTSGVLQ